MQRFGFVLNYMYVCVVCGYVQVSVGTYGSLELELQGYELPDEGARKQAGVFCKNTLLS